MYNKDDIIVYKCMIIQDLLDGKTPKMNDYIGKDGLTRNEYTKLIKDMESEGLINPINKTYNYSVIWFNGVTKRGVKFLEQYIAIICGE